MNINLNKNLIAVVIVFAMALGLTVVGSKVLIDKVAIRVIEELRREYSPGPYNPGFDPDKVDPNFFRNQQPPQAQPQQQYAPPRQPSRSIYDNMSPAEWNRAWQQQ